MGSAHSQLQPVPQTPRFAATAIESDEELLKREFRTTDPEGLPNIQMTVPGTSEVPTIEYRYDLTPAKGEDRPFVRCVHCRHPNHWRGYVMKYLDGRRTLVGKDCGYKLYEAEFTAVERDFRAGERRQLYLRRVRAAHKQFPTFLPFLDALVADPLVKEFSRCQRELRELFPPLWQLLVTSMRHSGGRMMVERRIRDYQAELKRAERKRDEGEEGHPEEDKDRPIYRTFEESVGTIEGGALVALPWDFADRVRLIRGRAKKLGDDVAKICGEWVPMEKLRDTVNSIQELVRHLRELLEQRDAPIRFFEAPNLSAIASWATGHPNGGGRYKVVGNTLAWESGIGRDDPIQVKAPRAHAGPSLDSLASLRQALTGIDN